MASPEGSIFVTGANGGLGSAIVKHIAESSKYAKSYYGIYTVRNTERADMAKKALQKAGSTGHKYDLVPLDLSSLASTRKVAEDINKRVADGSIPPIRALVLNAAWQEWTSHTMTEDGFDMTFQANYLSHFLLTLLLLKSMDKKNGRIVVLGSWSHDTTDNRNFVPGVIKPYVEEKWKVIFQEPVEIEPLARGKWSVPTEEDQSGDNGYRRYGASKLCGIMFMRELAKRIATDPTLSPITVLSIDPGAMPTSLTRRRTSNALVQGALEMIAPAVVAVISKFSHANNYRTTGQSASDVMYAAFNANKESLGGGGGNDDVKPNGAYLNGHVLSEPGPEARDDKKCEKLWAESVGFAGLKEGDTVLAAWR